MEDIKKVTMEIYGGPSRDLLFDACKYAFDEQSHFNVAFMVIEGYSMPKGDPRAACLLLDMREVRIRGLEYVDSVEGVVLLVKGYCNVNFDVRKLGEREDVYYEATYDPKSKKGTITFFVLPVSRK